MRVDTVDLADAQGCVVESSLDGVGEGVFASVGFYAVSAFVASAEAKQFCVDRCVAFEGAFERFENEDCCSFAENNAITSFVVWT